MKILIIYTGGTIGMIENPETGALESFSFKHLQSHVPELKRFAFGIDVHTFEKPVDSSDMMPRQWEELGDIIKKHYDIYDGFVVLHGTDTMVFTASALSFLLPNLTKPVIFTGSQLPIGQLRTDGKENLLTALEIAAAKDESGEAKVQEVCIFFENKLMRGNRTTKISAEGFNAFRSHNFHPLATAGVHIQYRTNKEKFQIRNWDWEGFHFCPDIVVLTLFPGIPESTVDAIAHTPGLRGIILRTFGSGNAPTAPWLLEKLREMADKGIVVVNITQCDQGSVEMGRYQTSRQLLEAGVVSGYDSTWECMLTKLMFLLGLNLNRDEIVEMLNTSLAGEITV